MAKVTTALVAEIKISWFTRCIYMPYVKICAKLTGNEPDLDKVMDFVVKHTKVTVKGINK